ncbi:hypothetical protein ABW636_04885 [Aquimarina sp. 2201CG1-2-11]|uniref:hypothetical protein n=1 Tax=Aquimarina discodermiae TaxID=3231043 RepID=UPI00346377B7
MAKSWKKIARQKAKQEEKLPKNSLNTNIDKDNEEVATILDSPATTPKVDPLALMQEVLPENEKLQHLLEERKLLEQKMIQLTQGGGNVFEGLSNPTVPLHKNQRYTGEIPSHNEKKKRERVWELKKTKAVEKNKEKKKAQPINKAVKQHKRLPLSMPENIAIDKSLFDVSAGKPTLNKKVLNPLQLIKKEKEMVVESNEKRKAVPKKEKEEEKKKIKSKKSITTKVKNREIVQKPSPKKEEFVTKKIDRFRGIGTGKTDVSKKFNELVKKKLRVDAGSLDELEKKQEQLRKILKFKRLENIKEEQKDEAKRNRLQEKRRSQRKDNRLL